MVFVSSTSVKSIHGDAVNRRHFCNRIVRKYPVESSTVIGTKRSPGVILRDAFNG